MVSIMVNPAMFGLAKGAGTFFGTKSLDRAKTGVAAALEQPESAVRAANLTLGEQVAPAPLHKVASPSPNAPPSFTHAASPNAQATAEHQRMAELAYSCLLGDTFAWEALVRSQQRRVYGLCYRFTGSTSEAEDLTQEVFLKVYRNLRSFDPTRASFGVWLTALTRNLLVDHYRRSRMERASESLDETLAGEDDGPTRAERLADTRGGGQERHVAGIELRAKIQAALAQVSPELREAVILRDLEDMDYREIADTLCIPQGTVKSRISRGRAELARLLKGLEGQVV